MHKSAALQAKAATGMNMSLIQAQSNFCLKQPGWEWADLDGTRLVWAESGCLWTASLTDSGLAEPRLLHDFNHMTFERRTAPY